MVISVGKDAHKVGIVVLLFIIIFIILVCVSHLFVVVDPFNQAKLTWRILQAQHGGTRF